MKLTRHNGRAGKNGVYNPKHNDRSFDTVSYTHLDVYKRQGQEFVYSLQEESAMKDIAVSETVKKRIERNQKRVHELDMLIRKIYEDNVIGRLPDRLFQSMLTDYENEQNELNKIIETDTADMQRIIGGQNNCLLYTSS